MKYLTTLLMLFALSSSGCTNKSSSKTDNTAAISKTDEEIVYNDSRNEDGTLNCDIILDSHVDGRFCGTVEPDNIRAVLRKVLTNHQKLGFESKIDFARQVTWFTRCRYNQSSLEPYAKGENVTLGASLYSRGLNIIIKKCTSPQRECGLLRFFLAKNLLWKVRNL